VPSFNPHDLRTLVAEAAAGGDHAFLLAFRQHTQNQAIKLLTQMGIDPSQPDAWQRGFFWLAYCYCGVGHLAWHERRSNKNAATWTPDKELKLLEAVIKLRAEGLSELAATQRIASDPQFKESLPYRQEGDRGSSNFSKQHATKKRQAALWRHLQHIKEQSSGPYALLDQLAGPGWNAQSAAERVLYAIDFIVASKLLASPSNVMKNADPSN
jgi:hypothetical protein